eukprot:3322528-Amphidinium_carterae.1
MLSLTWPRTCATKVRAHGRNVMHVASEEAERCHLQSASSATTGPAYATWQFQPAWPETTQCVRHIRSWSTAPTQTTLTSANTGSFLFLANGLGLVYRPSHGSTGRGLAPGSRGFLWLPRNYTATQLPCARQLGWLPPTCR